MILKTLLIGLPTFFGATYVSVADSPWPVTIDGKICPITLQNMGSNDYQLCNVCQITMKGNKYLMPPATDASQYLRSAEGYMLCPIYGSDTSRKKLDPTKLNHTGIIPNVDMDQVISVQMDQACVPNGVRTNAGLTSDDKSLPWQAENNYGSTGKNTLLSSQYGLANGHNLNNLYGQYCGQDANGYPINTLTTIPHDYHTIVM